MFGVYACFSSCHIVLFICHTGTLKSTCLFSYLVFVTVKNNCNHLVCFASVLVHFGPSFYVLALMRHCVFLSLWDVEL